MEVLDYTNMLNRFGKRLENAIAKDFPGNEDLSATINAALVKLHFAIIGAFMRTTDDKEKK